MTLDQAKIILDKLLTSSSGIRADALILSDGRGGAIETFTEDEIEALLVSTDLDSSAHASAFTLTDEQFKEIMPALPTSKRVQYLPFLNSAMEAFEITTPIRAAAFLAQIAYESVELKYFAEIWGPTPQQKKYEPTTDVSKSLGNTEKGDGVKFKGRGAMQITGRANYKKYGEMIGLDLIADPDLAEKPEHAFHTAGAFWAHNGLNELADKKDFTSITKKINGGLTGITDRQKYYAKAQQALCA